MEQAINYWIMEYHREGFVRWSILDCTSSTAIGTMELFKRSANDVYDNTAVLRLDLLSKYEEQSCLQEILSLILPHIRDLFQCTQVITKCVQEAEKRRAVLLEMGFSPSKEPLVGWDGTLYQNYYKRSNIKNENVYTGTKVLIYTFFVAPFIPDPALSNTDGLPL